MNNIPTLTKRSFQLFILLLFNSAIMSIAVSSIPNAAPYRCTVSPDWVGSGYDPADCYAANVQFFNQEVSVFGKKEYEFMGENAARAHRPLIPQLLPRRFTSGSCTLALGMLNLFPDRSLPGGDVGPFKETDVASYKDLYFAAQRLLRSCISNNEAAGFIAVGRSESIGVFLWATDSLQNQDLRGSALNSTTLTPGTAPPGAANTSGLLNGSPPAGDVSSTS